MSVWPLFSYWQWAWLTINHQYIPSDFGPADAYSIRPETVSTVQSPHIYSSRVLWPFTMESVYIFLVVCLTCTKNKFQLQGILRPDPSGGNSASSDPGRVKQSGFPTH